MDRTSTVLREPSLKFFHACRSASQSSRLAQGKGRASEAALTKVTTRTLSSVRANP